MAGCQRSVVYGRNLRVMADVLVTSGSDTTWTAPGHVERHVERGEPLLFSAYAPRYTFRSHSNWILMSAKKLARRENSVETPG